MNDEDVAVKLTALEHETKSAKHRLDDLEVQHKVIQDLAIAVRELTINMGNMLEEQKRQGNDIEKLKSEPGESWGKIKLAIITAIVGTGAGALATGIIYTMAQNIR